MHGLARVQAHRTFRAEPGQGGMGKRCHGRDGADIVIEVPPGTVVYEETTGGKRQLVDLGTYGSGTFRVARGGRGGRGNIHFATPTNQAPTLAIPGVPGEQKTLHLEVQHLADVGLVGLPNAGKSTLLARISRARPKIADYPFTTLEPHLGMVDIHDSSIVVADIPGLIEGASEGKGLGHQFLRHLLRTTVLVHLLDAQQPEPEAVYKVIRRELEEFNSELAARPEIVVVSKVDTLSSEAKAEVLARLHHLKPIALSAASGECIPELLEAISKVCALDN
ncbi:MAG: Obg family GTPase CgtA, partial [Patescibacteria group bacterium]